MNAIPNSPLPSIIMITRDFAEGKMGGAAKVVYDECQGLIKKGFSVQVITFGSEVQSGNKNYYVIDNIKVNVIPTPPELSGFTGNRMQSLLSRFSPRWSSVLSEMIEPFDIVHIHNVHSQTLFAYLVLASKRLKKKIIWTMHDYWFVCPRMSLMKTDGSICIQRDCFESCLKGMRLLKRMLMKLRKPLKYQPSINLVIAPSASMQTQLLKAGVESSKIRLLYNGASVNITQQGDDKDGTIILYAGYLGSHKGVEVLIKSFKFVTEEIPEAKLIIIGDGDQSNELREISTKLGLDATIEFLGWVPYGVLMNNFSSTDVFVLPSLWLENCSIALIEAMALGIPTITTNIGGNPELVKDGVTGFVVEPGNSKQLAQKLIVLLNDRLLRDKFSIAARERYEKEFLPQKHLNQLEEIYNEIMSYKA